MISHHITYHIYISTWKMHSHVYIQKTHALYIACCICAREREGLYNEGFYRDECISHFLSLTRRARREYKKKRENAPQEPSGMFPFIYLHLLPDPKKKRAGSERKEGPNGVGTHSALLSARHCFYYSCIVVD